MCRPWWIKTGCEAPFMLSVKAPLTFLDAQFALLCCIPTCYYNETSKYVNKYMPWKLNYSYLKWYVYLIIITCRNYIYSVCGCWWTILRVTMHDMNGNLLSHILYENYCTWRIFLSRQFLCNMCSVYYLSLIHI